MNMQENNKTNWASPLKYAIILLIGVFLGVFLIFYRIYKYGVIGYIEKRTERRRKRVDTLNNIFRDTY